DLVLRALLNPGDEVLIPSPDYPLWTAATLLNGGNPVHYPCLPENLFQPDLGALAARITPRSRAIVIINPNNPTGTVYSANVLREIVQLAEQHGLIILADEIYDQMVFDDAEFIPMATLVEDTLCGTFSGLSKVYRASGYRVGWVSFNGALDRSHDYLHALELLASLRLCSNVPGQWAVQTALGGHQSIAALCQPGGRLYESRRAVIDAVNASEYLHLPDAPMGAMYAFVGVDTNAIPGFDDQSFALELLESEHVLIAPGSSFNVPYRNYFRMTTLPDKDTLGDVFVRINRVLAHQQSRNQTPRLEIASDERIGG
ncbi:MAG: aminotransferase class I/II-fold pyridoxal phosphate-dependent enzyme, partial [Gammaproteobacteria bacterium]|nr:aminotransferase class I/II-fold pyridoxal phosphate-dependent enzyme [Gammaproteobacteria bacterium]